MSVRNLIGMIAIIAAAGTTRALAQPLTSAFTYQGELDSGGSPATGNYDFRFRLYDAISGGNQIGSTLCNNDTNVANGRFLASLDFGLVFTGQKRFLEIEVRQDSGLDCSNLTGFTLLASRQELTASPNANYAQTAGTASNAAALNGQPASFYTNASNLTGSIADARLSSNVAKLNGNQTFTGLTSFTNTSNSFRGTFTGSGSGLTNLNGGSIQTGTLARSSLNSDVAGGIGTMTLDLSSTGSAQTGSHPQSVAVSGSFAYVVNYDSNTLQVFNLNSGSAPTLAATIATGAAPISVAVSGSYAYVVNQNSNSMQVFNISIPSAPTLAGTITTGGSPVSVAVSGSYAYIVNYNSNTMQVFNISNPAGPTLAGSIATGDSPSAITVSGSFAYVLNNGSGSMQIFNIGTPQTLGLVGTVATGAFPISVAVSGSYAYVVNNGSNTLQIFNISNPQAPALARSLGTGASPYSVAVMGSYAYLASYGANQLEVYNITNPTAPASGGIVATGTGPVSVAASGGYVCVANFDSNSVQVFTSASKVGFGAPLAASALSGVNGSGLTNLNAANLSGSVPAARLTSVPAASLTGTLPASALSGVNGSGLTNLNGGSISAGTLARSSLNTDALSGLGTLTFELSNSGSAQTGSTPESVAVSGSFAYVINYDSNTLQVFNISNPTAPTPAGTTPTGAHPSFVAVSGSFAYVVNYDSNTLQVFNISNPTAPTPAGTIPTGAHPSFVAVSGSFAYVVNQSSNTLQIFSISNPAAPVLAGTIGTGNNPNSVAVSGSYAYVVNASSNSLQVFNISNPAVPVLTGTFATGIYPYCVAINGAYAYVTNYLSNTLQVFNLANPAAPALGGSFATGSGPSSVAVSGSFIYVTCSESNTLQAFNIIAPGAPALAASIGTGASPFSVTVAGDYAYVTNEGANSLQIFNAVSKVGFGAPLAASALLGVNGSGLTNLNASNLRGTVPAANLTSVPSASLTGSIDDARLSGNVARLNGTQTFTGANSFANASNAFIGNGSGLTNLNAFNITAGTLLEARLSSNIPRLNASSQAFQGLNWFTSKVGIGYAAGTPETLLDIRGTTNALDGHIARFENTAPDGQGIAIQIDNDITNADNNFITFYNGTGAVVGRIEGFDLAHGDWNPMPPLPSEIVNGFSSFHIDPGINVRPTADWFSPGRAPSANMQGGSLPNMRNINWSFNWDFDRGSFPSLSFDPGALPSVNQNSLLSFGTPTIGYALPTKEEWLPIVEWGLDNDLQSLIALDPLEIAVAANVIVATQLVKDGGITYGSKGADYAEYLLKINQKDNIRFGEVVGIFGGKISRKTSGAERVMVISRAPAVVGNQPPDNDCSAYEKVAFMGQVPVAVVGGAMVGDFIAASGFENGLAVAIHPADLRPEHMERIVGRAWANSTNARFDFINTHIGAKEEAAAMLLDREIKKNKAAATTSEALRAENQEIKARLGRLEELLSKSQR